MSKNKYRCTIEGIRNPATACGVYLKLCGLGIVDEPSFNAVAEKVGDYAKAPKKGFVLTCAIPANNIKKLGAIGGFVVTYTSNPGIFTAKLEEAAP